MEIYERKDFIQIDYKDGKFQTVCMTKATAIIDTEDESMRLEVMQQFNENLEECIKFTIGAMSAIRLFKEGIYKPVDYIEIIYTRQAKERILNKKYKVAECIYPDIKALKEVWKLSLR